jgi:hypothetical protein
MRYATELGDTSLGSLTDFCRKLGVDMPQPEDKLVIKPGDLGETMSLRVLTPTAIPFAGSGPFPLLSAV